MVDKAQQDHIFKMILLGGSAVGKSSILQKFTRDQFNSDNKTTVGVQYATKMVEANSKKIKLQIWDTCGQEKFKALMRAYYKGASAALLVYDITDQVSFNSLDYWYSQIKEYSKNEMVIMLVGNKSDLEDKRAITKQKGFQYAQNKKIAFYEVSAKEGTNISLIFNKIAEELEKLVSEAEVKQTINTKIKENQVINPKLMQPSNIMLKENQKKQRKDGKKCCGDN